MTSVIGHLTSNEFDPRYKNWTSCNPSALFDARVNEIVDPVCKMPKHAQEAQLSYFSQGQEIYRR